MVNRFIAGPIQEKMTLSKRSSQTVSNFLWALVLLCLPVTSFRYFPLFGSGTVVRPLALYPLVLLLAILAYRFWRGEFDQKILPNSQLLLLFASLVVFTGVLGGLETLAEGTSASFTGRFLRALVTILIGFGFYFAAAAMNRSVDQVRFSLLWLVVGLGLTFIWGSIQFYGLNHGLRGELLEFQNLFSVRGLVKNKRVSGFAYEPSWLANQLVTVYFPWIIGSLTVGIGMFQSKLITSRFGKFDWLVTDLLLLMAASALLLFTYSRSGLAVLAASLLLTIALTGTQALKSSFAWFFKPKPEKRALGLLTRFGIVLVFVGGIAGIVYFLTDKGYISAFFQKNTDNIFDYLQKAYLGPRFAYLVAAISAAIERPFSGVGLGASGFWVLENMPDWALAGNAEIARLLSPSTNIFPNPKNLFVRVLAETGIFGFILLVLYFLSLFGMALYLLESSRNKPEDHWTRLVGIAGVFGVTAVILGGFSQDSFAMPELWITPGILAGFFQAHQNQQRGQQE